MVFDLVVNVQVPPVVNSEPFLATTCHEYFVPALSFGSDRSELVKPDRYGADGLAWALGQK